ncbi:MAG: pitrilysin family protein [Byssovorax sp.]
MLAALGAAQGATLATPALAGDAPRAPVAQTGGKGAAPAKPKATAKPPEPKAAKPAAKPAKPAAAPAPKPAKTALAPAPSDAIELRLAVQRETFDNGLRVVLNVDHTSPTVAVAVVYDVGSRNEQEGRSGFAHLFEHMMFQGSQNVEKGGHFKLISAHGGILNGTTNSDRTNYFEVLPANELALGLWLEADRMKSLDVSGANFENQRKVVQEEYRMRVSNAAYVPSELRRDELVFEGYWPYAHSTIGSMADLDGAKLDWVRDFHAHYYGPNNAVLVISGDFDPNEALAMAHRYFDSAKKVSVTPFVDPPFPEQTSQRTAVVHDDNARFPGVLYGWAIPPMRSADHYALELASTLLGDGDSSRLHQLLVRDKGFAQNASAHTDDRRGADLFAIDVRLSATGDLGKVEKLVEDEVKALATKGPSDAEVEKVRSQVKSGLLLQLQSNLSRARRLGEYEVYFGDARQLNAELPRYLAVTKEDIKRVTAQYLSPTRRTIVETLPAKHEQADDADKKPADKAEKKPPAKVEKKPPEKKPADKAPAAPPKKQGGPAAPAAPAKKGAKK